MRAPRSRAHPPPTPSPHGPPRLPLPSTSYGWPLIYRRMAEQSRYLVTDGATRAYVNSRLRDAIRAPSQAYDVLTDAVRACSRPSTAAARSHTAPPRRSTFHRFSPRAATTLTAHPTPSIRPTNLRTARR